MIIVYENTTFLITGVCGSVGSALLEVLHERRAKRVVCLDNNESELFYLHEKYRKDKNVEFYLSDLRDYASLSLRMKRVDVVLHAAALKHVGMCEVSPVEAVKTNILGTQNVIDAAKHCNVSRVVFTSSDKAVNPTNVMGTSKLMGERLISAASENNRGGPVFAATRFGNVIGSRGSVVPLFRRQIENGGPVTLTHSEMTRFIMTVGEAASLVLDTAWSAQGGEVFVTKMPVCSIKLLAQVMIEKYSSGSCKIEEIGVKPGEKMYEELMSDEELRRAYELKNFYVILPALAANDERYGLYADKPRPTRPYNSAGEKQMSSEELTAYLP